MPAEVHVVFGPMFAGKTEVLFRLIRLEKIAKRTVLVIKSHVDTKTENCIASRAVVNGKAEIQEEYPATIITCEEGLRRAMCEPFDTLIIDEGQFFQEPWFLKHLMALLRREHPNKLLVIVSGLDTDYQVKPFGYMPQLMAIADRKTALTGICMHCYSYGASLTQRIQRDEQEESPAQQVVIDKGDNYEIRCKFCHEAFAADEIEAEFLRRPSK